MKEIAPKHALRRAARTRTDKSDIDRGVLADFPVAKRSDALFLFISYINQIQPVKFFPPYNVARLAGRVPPTL